MKQNIEDCVKFIGQIDALKGITRAAFVLGGSRNENSAEHSWHVAVSALLLTQFSDQQLDAGRVVAMLLIHDIVEIDAGDTVLFDTAAMATKKLREEAAAERLFGLLPEEPESHVRDLWLEFEAGVTPEARFANAIDRFLPIVLNTVCEGRAWRENGVEKDKLIEKSRCIADISGPLWSHALAMIEDGNQRGWLK